MKPTKGIITLLFAIGLFVSCDTESDDVIWDIAPVDFNLYIADSEGRDLLDSTCQDNLIKDITVTYQGQTYPVITEREYYQKKYGDTLTRAYMPQFYGLILRQSWSTKTLNPDSFILVFGEFDGTENIEKREITLNLPGGHQTILSYMNRFRWKSNGAPEKSTVYYLDGQQVNDDYGKCGVYHFQYSDSHGLKYNISR